MMSNHYQCKYKAVYKMICRCEPCSRGKQMEKHVECVTDLAKDIGNERDIGEALTYTIIEKNQAFIIIHPIFH